MKRTIRTQIIVESGDIYLAALIEAVSEHLKKKGYTVSVPHVYPEDPLIIDMSNEKIEHITYG